MKSFAQLLFAVITAFILSISLSNQHPAQAQVPANGKIAFASSRNGALEIYTMKSDGTNLRRLTNNTAPDTEPTFSPDGTRIVFTRKTSAASGSEEIFVMNADGSNQTRLTNNAVTDSQPAWSADGKKIVFMSQRDGLTNQEIYVMNADGTNPVNLTNTAAGTSEFLPKWSPLGDKILYSRQLGTSADVEVYVMNADGSNQHDISNDPLSDIAYGWSPDGTKVVFRSDRNVIDTVNPSNNQEIYVMNADGSNQTRLTFNSSIDTQPKWSPDGSKIAFLSVRDGNSEVYLMNPDGTGATNITNQPSFADQQPDWQRLRANGRIAFGSDKDGNPEIYSMNPSSSDQVRLTNTAAVEFDASSSFDGSKIVFRSDRDGDPEIYLMNSDGSNQTRLTNSPALDNQPSLSPDGTKIAFVSNRDGNSEIYSMNSDGTAPVRLTTATAADIAPAWSPDGTRILFASRRGGDNILKLFVMNADGTNQTQLTVSNVGDLDPAWSPDGSKIAFSAARDGNREIYVMNADGTNQTRLTNNTAFDGQPFWSPDGTQIAFASDRDASTFVFDIYVMNADGSNQTRVLATPGSEGHPSWQPLLATPTATGSNVTVQSGDVNINFAGVSGGGFTAAASIEPSTVGPLPPGFAIDGTSFAYEISTTATVTPPINVCFNVPSINDQPTFDSLVVLHREDGQLAPKPTTHDFPNRMLCTTVNSFSPFIVVRDVAAPTLSPTVSPNPVFLNGSATATPNASDAGSGIASQSCDPVDTSSVGVKSVQCTATDNAGFTTVKSASYTVIYNLGLLYDPTKASKLGSTIPIRLQLVDALGANVSSSAVAVKAAGISIAAADAPGETAEDAGNANPDFNFRYDPSLVGYGYNLSTKGLQANTTYKLYFTVGSETYLYSVQFQVK